MRLEIPLRWGDMDAQGHVNNARFVDYLQEARADYLLASPVPHMLGGGVLVLAHQVEFLAPVEFSLEPVEIVVGVQSCQRAQLALWYELRHAGRLCARARTRLCPYDLQTGAVRRLTPDEKTFFSSALEPMDPLRDLTRVRVGDAGMGTPMRVRWGDLDSYGHVNNVPFFEYVQEGRIAFSTRAFDELAPTSASAGGDTMWFVVRQDIDYHAQLSFRAEPYEMRTGVASTGTTSSTLCSQLWDPATGEVFATAATVVVCGDLQGRPKTIPEAWKQALEPYRLG